MKKLFYFLLSVAVIAGAAGILTACDNAQTVTPGTGNPVEETPSDDTPANTGLAAPANLQWDKQTWTLSWDAVDGAESYVIYTTDTLEFFYSTENFCDLEYSLTTNSTANIVVHALSENDSSDWSEEITIQTESSTAALAYTLMADGQGYSVDRLYSDVNKGLEGRVVIADYYNGLPVKEIAYQMFMNGSFGVSFNTETGENCNTVTTSIHLPKYLEIIGEDAFSYCIALEEIYIPDCVTEICKSAFDCCVSLKTINFPSGITEIPSSMLFGTGITEITIPSYINSIGGSAFSNCKNLTKVTINANIPIINISTFNGCISLTDINIPESVTEIGIYAFNDCSSLAKFTIPDSVNYIGSYAFSNTAVSEITISENITYIGSNAFYGCSSLVTVNFLVHPEYMGDKVFYGTAWLNEQTDDYIIINGDILYGYQGADTQINSLPSQIKYIAGGAFEENTAITSVDISGVTSIGSLMFYKCTSLVSAKITDISGNLDSMFSYCLGLKQVELCGNIQSVGGSMFDMCIALESVVLNDSLQTVGDSAFYDCIALKSIVIPDSVTVIGERAFLSCSKLAEVYVGSGLTSVGARAFGSLKNAVFYYNGTEEQFGNIAIDSYNTPFIENVYYYSQTEPALNEEGTAYAGKYWHYNNDGEVVVWTV